MTTYKVGDEVLVRATIVGRNEHNYAALIDNGLEAWIPPRIIHSLAPGPEVDWTTVPMGARVRARVKSGEPVPARFVMFNPSDTTFPFCVLPDGMFEVWYVANCELVEEGGDE